MSLRWRIAIGFALVALGTAAVIALATPPIVTQGFADVDDDSVPTLSQPPGASDDLATDPPEQPAVTAAHPTATAAIPRETESEAGDGAVAVALAPRPTATATNHPAATTPVSTAQAEQTTILRLMIAALGAVIVASLLGLWGAGRLVRPLTRLEQAAAAVARGDLTRRSGVADRSDEFGQLGRTFDSMASQLQLADETRRRFLQDAAHELKTPLAVIEATSSAIIDGVYTPEKRHLETIRDQSRVLARIVDDLRTISLAEGGHLPLERRPLDVRAVLDSIAAGFEARAATNSVKLATGGAAGIVVEADPERLRQIVGALVDNALRHTPAGGSVNLAAAAMVTPGPTVAGKATAPRAIVRITVDDSGPGIPPDSLSSIFERFYQADTSRSRGSGTSGLGLSIVRALAEAHGGHAGAENRPEGGARLWIELPALRFT